MMLPTHAFMGMALALPYALTVPEFGGIALVAGLIGGVVPDLDMYAGHRKTLHYPVYYSVLASAVVPVAVLTPTPLTVALAFLLLAGAIHSVTDIFGGGLELRPWEATSDHAVYDHYRAQWIAPRRWVRYDGAPEDLLLAVTLAMPLLIALEGVLRWIVILALVVTVVYTAVRRTLPTVANLLVDGLLVPRLPNSVLPYVPARYLDEKEQLITAPAEE